MADTKVSALTAATAFLDADEFPVNEAGTSKKVSGTLLKAWVGNILDNVAVADQTINASTTAYLANSSIAVTVRKLRIGTYFIWRVWVNKTAAGTLGVVFTVRIGTAGTTADATVLTFTLPTATANADEAYIDIIVTVRGPLSASGILQGGLNMAHNLQTTGFSTTPGVCLAVTSSTFNVTTASLIVGLACTTPASTVLLFRQITAEAKNL